MATLANNSSGNFTAAATWSLIDATTFLNSESNTTNTTTSFVGPVAGATPGAITIDAILIKVSARNAVPSGTFSVRLFDITAAAAVAGTTVTINVSDIPSASPNGWVCMKFAASVLLLVGNSYRVEVQSSVSAQVTIYRDGTAANWSKGLRTTTTQAPAAGDDLRVVGEFLSAGVNSTYTVTMDNTAVTTFGSNVTPSAANGFGSGLSISAKGILAWGTAAATNYYFKVAGNMTVYAGGVYQCGTVGTPMPVGSMADLEFACTSNVQFGFEARINSTVTMHGAVVTESAFLAANAAIAATALTTDISTGWLTGDVIALASTTRTATEAESKALTANAVGTALTITALTNAHSGSLPTRAELINLTRNIQIFGTSTAFQGYVNITDVTADIRYVEFYQLGSNTALKRGIDFNPILNTGVLRSCSFHDYIVANSLGLNISSGTANNWTVDRCVSYNIANTSLNIGGLTTTAWTLSNHIGIRSVAGSLISISGMDGTITNITATSGGSTGISFADLTFTSTTISGITAHSNAGSGISVVNVTALAPTTITTLNSWNNNSNGITVNNIFDIVFDGGSIFGNLTTNITSSQHYAVCTWKNMVVNGGLPLACPIGYQTGADQSKIIIDTCTFGVTTPHSTADVLGVTNTYADITFRNCLLSSANKVVSNNIMINGTELKFAKFQQTVGNHITYKKFGTMQNDAAIFNFATPSARMTPNTAGQKLEGGLKKVAVPITTTVTISVYVRKSILGDGAAYNGTQPRIILKADPAIGLLVDTVIATGVSANGIWEKLSGTTPAITDNAVFQFVVDCDGTAGWVNIDDWNAK